MDSLVKLAQEKKLPPIQIMDKETLYWIESRRPSFQDSYTFPSEILEASRELLVRFVPLDEWFTAPRMGEGMHGRRHLLRVVFHASVVARCAGCSEEEVELVALVALLHDIRRIDDKGDEGHDVRSSAWFSDNSLQVAESVGMSLSTAQTALIGTILAGREQTNPTAQRFREYVETADALDRYRLPKEKWWIDESYLTVHPHEWHKCLAFDFVVESERMALNGEVDIESILKALTRLI